MNIYSHVMPTQLAAAADAIGTALWGVDEDRADDDAADERTSGRRACDVLGYSTAYLWI